MYQWKPHAGEDVLDRGISYAFDIVVAKTRHQYVKHDPHDQHSRNVLDVAPAFDMVLEEVLESINRVDE